MITVSSSDPTNVRVIPTYEQGETVLVRTGESSFIKGIIEKAGITADKQIVYLIKDSTSGKMLKATERSIKPEPDRAYYTPRVDDDDDEDYGCEDDE